MFRFLQQNGSVGHYFFFSEAQGQPQNLDIERNYLVIQTMRMKIPFIMSKYNLFLYDEKQFGHEGKNTSACGENFSDGSDNPGVSSFDGIVRMAAYAFQHDGVFCHLHTHNRYSSDRQSRC